MRMRVGVRVRASIRVISSSYILFAIANLIDEMKMNKMFLFRFMNAYFAVLIAQMDDFVRQAESNGNNLTSGRSKTDPKTSPELVNLKKVFQHEKFKDSDLQEFSKALEP